MMTSFHSFPLKCFFGLSLPEMGDYFYGSDKNAIMERLLSSCLLKYEIWLNLTSLQDGWNVNLWKGGNQRKTAFTLLFSKREIIGKASPLWLFRSVISRALISTIYGLFNICRALNVIIGNEILELELTLVVILFFLLILKTRQLRRETVLPLGKSNCWTDRCKCLINSLEFGAARDTYTDTLTHLL